MNRSTAKYLALLAVVATLFDWKIMLTRQFTMLVGMEGVNNTYSWLHFWIRSLRGGHLPLWDPYGFCGHPFAMDMLPSAFYPLHLLFLLVPFNSAGFFSPQLYNEIFVISRLLCLYFTFALIRELRLSRFSAFIGACCFSLSGLLGGLPWPYYIEAAIWLPLIFLFLLRALRAPEMAKAVREASLSGLCWGMSILTGGLHFSIMQGIFILTAVLYYAASTAPALGLDRQAHWRRMLLILATIVMVGAGAGAVQLLPEFEYTKLSLRFIEGGAFPANAKIPYHRLNLGMWPQSILAVLIPYAYGKVGIGEVWSGYIGVFPFFLAVTAVWKKHHTVWVRYLAGLAVVAYAYTLAEFSPLHGWLYALVPYLWTVREASRFAYLISFPLAVLAAIGSEILLHETAQNETWERARQILKWLAVACGVALFVPAVFNQLGLNILVALSLVLILASCGWFYYLTAKRAGSSACFLLAAFIVFDLNAFHVGIANKNAPDHPDEQFDQMVSLRGVANFLKTQPGLGRVRVGVVPEPNLGDVYGVQAIWGGGGTVLTSHSSLTALRPDLLNGRYIVRPASAANPAPIYQDAYWKVYVDPAAYPRAWFVHRTEIEQSQEAALQRLKDPAIDFHKVAVIESRLPQALDQTAAPNEQARFTSYEPNRMALDIIAGGPSLLVLSEMHYPGWRATVNGKSTDVLRVDGGLRGIVVPAGKSRVELNYVPVEIYAGGLLSLFTIAGVLTAVVLAWYQNRVVPAKLQGSASISI